MVMLVTFCRFSFEYPSLPNFNNLAHEHNSFVCVASPPNPLLTQFRKLQPSPLKVGDHFIGVFLQVLFVTGCKKSFNPPSRKIVRCLQGERASKVGPLSLVKMLRSLLKQTLLLSSSCVSVVSKSGTLEPRS